LCDNETKIANDIIKVMESNTEEKTRHSLDRISSAIQGLTGTIERLYEDWKFPVKTMAEHMEPEWEKQRKEEELELLRKQNKLLFLTVVVAIVGIVVTAWIGISGKLPPSSP